MISNVDQLYYTNSNSENKNIKRSGVSSGSKKYELDSEIDELSRKKSFTKSRLVQHKIQMNSKLDSSSSLSSLSSDNEGQMDEGDDDYTLIRMRSRRGKKQGNCNRFLNVIINFIINII
jgi:hypothetical protein